MEAEVNTKKNTRGHFIKERIVGFVTKIVTWATKICSKHPKFFDILINTIGCVVTLFPFLLPALYQNNQGIIISIIAFSVIIVFFISQAGEAQYRVSLLEEKHSSDCEKMIANQKNEIERIRQEANNKEKTITTQMKQITAYISELEIHLSEAIHAIHKTKSSDTVSAKAFNTTEQLLSKGEKLLSSIYNTPISMSVRFNKATDTNASELYSRGKNCVASRQNIINSNERIVQQQDNTAYSFLISSDMPFFSSGNLSKQNGFCCDYKKEEWESFMQSTIVIPIRIRENYTKPGCPFTIYGFLCVDASIEIPCWNPEMIQEEAAFDLLQALAVSLLILSKRSTAALRSLQVSN